MACCKGKGPGYASPLDAFKNGPREELMYVVCIQPDKTKQDYLATVDVDPKSPTYSQVIHRTFTGSPGDELHHSGWNVCSSCHDDPSLKRDLLILPALNSAKVFAVDVGSDPRKPKMHKVIDGSEMRSFNCSYPHTTHCLATGEIMISTMGDKDENGKGDFVLIDSKTLKMTGTWTKGNKTANFGYDFWYQPYHDVMFSTEWGAPKRFKRFYKTSDGTWKADKVIDVPAKKVSKDGVESEINGLLGDIIISLDDKYLYCSCWMHGDVRQYDISDPEHPKLTGRVQLGGVIASDPDIKVLEDKELKERPEQVTVKGKTLQGACQMLQLSLDGKRLFVSSSLYSPWDTQFYPKMVKEGGWMVKLDVDTVNGGMKLDPDFLVHFGEEPDGPALPHEMRYPGGDCTSDIWLASD
ncbi:methanethiol oxidase isoform X3 [Anticarsia gemmatalis]|uniref:methanethiol oxidase isoform X3 n=1 Tax=Anticarsia gemmatalis TaxID=129554 RepID=UPI003F75F749